MTNLQKESAELFPIRTVATITGINPVTLRAWERRYSLIKPHRTATGHRVYSARDIDIINRAVMLVGKGHSISQVAVMLRASADQVAQGKVVTDGKWSDYRTQMLASISVFSEDELDNIYNEVLALHSLDLVNKKIIVPLLEQLGDRWESGAGTVAEEHFFGFYLRNKLGARYHHHNRRNLGPRLITACLPGEAHESGLLLFGLAALDRGFRLINLGANMPLEDLPTVIRRSGADALILSGRLDPAANLFKKSLATIVRQTEKPVLVGGRVSVNFSAQIESSGATVLGDDISNGLLVIEKMFTGSKKP